MPYDIAWRERSVELQFSGTVGADEFLACVQAVGADPRFDRLQFIVNDFLGIECCAFDTPHVQESLAAMSIGAQATNPVVRMIVIATDERVAAFVHELRELTGGVGPDVAAFPSRDVARAWMLRQPLRVGYRLSRF